MKTLDEVIETLENVDRQWLNAHNQMNYSDFLDTLAYLREYQLLQDLGVYSNEPLTWEQIKDMEGRPVWVEYCSDKRWIVIAEVRVDVFSVEYIQATDGGRFSQKDLGTLWNAYRKERTDGEA